MCNLQKCFYKNNNRSPFTRTKVKAYNLKDFFFVCRETFQLFFFPLSLIALQNFTFVIRYFKGRISASLICYFGTILILVAGNFFVSILRLFFSREVFTRWNCLITFKDRISELRWKTSRNVSHAKSCAALLD